MGKRLTNSEFVTELMEFSRTGVVAQLLIIEAIRRYAKQVAEAPAESFADMQMISGSAWQAAAREINERMTERLV